MKSLGSLVELEQHFPKMAMVRRKGSTAWEDYGRITAHEFDLAARRALLVVQWRGETTAHWIKPDLVELAGEADAETRGLLDPGRRELEERFRPPCTVHHKERAYPWRERYGIVVAVEFDEHDETVYGWVRWHGSGRWIDRIRLEDLTR